MAWTAPRTWTTSEVVTAAIMNIHVRDNLLETAPAKATTATGFFIATGANALAERVPGYAIGDSGYTGSGTGDDIFASYAAAAWGSGTNVAVTVTTAVRALILHGFEKCESSSGGQLIYQSYGVSGATTIASNSAWRAVSEAASANGAGSMRLHYRDDLTAGSNTFTLGGASSDISVSTIRRPFIWVLPL